MPTICFFGPDGSGKTTLSRKLAKELSSNGFNVKISWMRGTHTFASVLAKFLSKFSNFRGSDNPYYGITISRSLKRLWQLVEFASALPIILIRFMLPSALGSWVIADRYVPDFITWVSFTTDDQHYVKSAEAKLLLALSSKAYTRIYVTASLKGLSRRGINPDFVRKQQKFYDEIAPIIRAKRLDTTHKSINESLKEVLHILNIHARKPASVMLK